MSRASSAVNNSSWSNYSSDNDSGILAKLRKLKIQEKLLLQNVNKTLLKNYDSGEDLIEPYSSSGNKSYISNIRNFYSEIKNMFDSLKCNTTSQEALKSYDIDDIKNDVLVLEAKIKKFKNYLLSEQTSLRSQELELIKQINVTESSENMTKHHKIKTKSFSEIVPSPVKRIISSPFKYQEVHEYQEFLKNHHRYGGWNEYSHNIFVQSWVKHFKTEINSDVEVDDVEIENSIEFLSEIGDKIPGLTKGDIIQHRKWYLEYLHLKRRQQDALNKWRAKKKIIKKTQSKFKEEKNIENKKYTICHKNEENPQKCTKRVKNFVSDEMKRIEEMFSFDPLDLSTDLTFDTNTRDEMYFSHSSNIPMEKNDINSDNFNKQQSRTQQLKSKMEKRRGLFLFAKSTQQWTNKINDKIPHVKTFATYEPQLENIEKLCIPKWRSYIKN